MLYSKLAKIYEKLDNTSKRIDKTYHIARLLKKADKKDINALILLIQGRIFSFVSTLKTGVSSKIVIKAISLSTGIDEKRLNDVWRQTGDLGKTAQKLVDKKEQATLFSNKLTISYVLNKLQKLALSEGTGSVDDKIKMIANLLTSASPIEARYIVRTVLEDLRIGVGDSVLRDAICEAFLPKPIGIYFLCECKEYVQADICPSCNRPIKQDFLKEIAHASKDIPTISSCDKLDDIDSELFRCNSEKKARKCYNYIANVVQEAYDISNDMSKVALVAKEKGIKGLKSINLEIGKPIKCMLFLKAKNIEDAFETVGIPAAIDYKYDGFRLQVHKKQNKVILFTRRFEDVTKQFPDVVKNVKQINADEFILDSEAVGYDPKTLRYLPFQSISRRIRRKYDIGSIAKKLPVELNVFDILYLNGKNLLKEPFEKRRKLLSEIIVHKEKQIVLSRITITNSVSEVDKFYNNALDEGHEGVMFKKLDAPYKPGARVGYGMKLKPVMDSLDLVIVKAEWGEGKRANWLTSFTIACMDDDGNLLEIGKVSTGLKELESDKGTSYADMTKMLDILSQDGKNVVVKPNVIVEVNFEEIQKSNSYSSGYALRFPRFVRLREDKDQPSSLSMIEDQFFSQKKR